MDTPLAGSRVRFGSGWATVARVEGDIVFAVLEGENTVVMLPRAACTTGAIATVAKRVRAVQRRHTWTETRDRRDQTRRLDRVLLAQTSRGGSRERRPRRRRVASSPRRARAPSRL